jgi:ribosomal protein S6--L-glutamate ligase
LSREYEVIPVKFFFLLARRVPDGPSQIVLEVSELLARRGHQIASVIAEESLTPLGDMPCDHDLYLLKSYTELSLSLAGALDARGASLINPFTGCVAARNKIVCCQVLREAGVPVPQSWVTSDFTLLKPLLQQFPLIVKPNMGWRGEGVTLVRNEKELAGLSLPSGPVLIQEYIRNNGEDLRLYVAGDRVFGIRKRFSETSFSIPGEPVAVSDEIREIALRCGRAFGMQLYGIDIIEGPDGPRVVDVNYFPGYKGVPGATQAVADCIERFAGASRPVFTNSLAEVTR